MAAATLPSGQVLVFDRGGRALKLLGGPFETVKDRVARDLGSAGSYFRIDGETNVYASINAGSGEVSSGNLDSGMAIEVTFTAIECAPEGWSTGCFDGRPVGSATFIAERNRKLVPPEEIWALIRAATLRSRNARG